MNKEAKLEKRMSEKNGKCNKVRRFCEKRRDGTKKKEKKGGIMRDVTREGGREEDEGEKGRVWIIRGGGDGRKEGGGREGGKGGKQSRRKSMKRKHREGKTCNFSFIFLRLFS